MVKQPTLWWNNISIWLQSFIFQWTIPL